MSRTALARFVFIVAAASVAQSGATHAALVAHWTFDDPGNPYADSSGYGNHGTAIGAPTLAAGVMGRYALDLNGASYLDVGSGAAFDTQTYTVSAWLRPDVNAGWRTAVGSWHGGAYWVHFGLDGSNNGRFSNYVYANSAQVNAIGTTTVPAGNTAWYHVVSVADPLNDKLQIWVNGVLERDTTVPGWTATQVPGLNNVFIGVKDSAGGNKWDGGIDDVRIYDHALSGTEIGQLFLQARENPEKGLVSYWTFDGHVADVARQYRSNVGTAEDNLAPQGGAVLFEPGRVGQAVRIGVQPGDATYYTAPFSADVKLPATYTIEAWIKPSELSDSWQRLVLNWGSAERSYHFAIRNNGGFTNAVSLFHEQSNGAQPNANGGTVLLDQWQHIAGVADGQFLRVYLNGVQVGVTAYDGTIRNIFTEGLGIGDSYSAASSIRFNGLLDELAIWNVPLSQQQILAHFLAGSAGYNLAVPEPATWALLALGGLGLAGIAVRRRARR